MAATLREPANNGTINCAFWVSVSSSEPWPGVDIEIGMSSPAPPFTNPPQPAPKKKIRMHPPRGWTGDVIHVPGKGRGGYVTQPDWKRRWLMSLCDYFSQTVLRANEGRTVTIKILKPDGTVLATATVNLSKKCDCPNNQ